MAENTRIVSRSREELRVVVYDSGDNAMLRVRLLRDLSLKELWSRIVAQYDLAYTDTHMSASLVLTSYNTALRTPARAAA